MPVRLAALLLGASGCYTYVPLVRAEPAPERILAFELNDQGRAGMADHVGPATERIEGRLVERTETDYVISVTHVVGARGKSYRWNGETVVVNQTFVRDVRERRLSKPRTAFTVAGIAGSFLAFIASRSLGVFGGSDGTDGKPPGDGGEQ